MTYRAGLAALLLLAACKEKTSASAPPSADAASAAEPQPARPERASQLVNVSGAAVIVAAAEHADGTVTSFPVPEGEAAAVLGPDGASLGGVGPDTLAAVVPGPSLVVIDPVAAPPAGKGTVVLRGDGLRGAAFTVGDGSGKCLHQRLQDDGFAAATLGGAYPVVVDLPPGAQRIALHRWPGKPCATGVARTLTVDVAAGATVVVFVRRADDGALSELTLAR